MEDAPLTVLAAFVAFSRIGACLLLMPGFSSPRVPVTVRLFLAIAVSLSLTALLIDELKPLVTGIAPVALLRLMGSELLIGATIGMLGRIFFVALETIGVSVAMAIGLSSSLGAPVNEDEPLPALTSLLTLAATILIFLTDQHLEVVRALAASYRSLPAAEGFSVRFALSQLTQESALAFGLALRLGSPFLILSVILNFAVGLTNRLVPTVQIFFLASPFLLMGGLVLLYLTAQPLLRLFVEAFARFLVTG